MRHVTLNVLAFYLALTTLAGSLRGDGIHPDDQVPSPGPARSEGETVRKFVRGDVDHNGEIDPADPQAIWSHLVNGGTEFRCFDAADADDDGDVDYADGIYLAEFLWLGGPPPPFPSSTCGFDPTDDELPPCELDVCLLWPSFKLADPDSEPVLSEASDSSPVRVP
jgi:hypothetical protein